MPIYALGDVSPRFADPDRTYIAPGAQVCGDIRIGLDVSVWFNAVVRADNAAITIGDRTNIQDGAMVHADPGVPTTIGCDVTIGHHAIIHGATIGDATLVGMGATILNGATIGTHCLIGANALVTEGKVFPDGSLIVGAPATLKRMLTEQEIAGLSGSASSYVANGHKFAAELRVVAQGAGGQLADADESG